VTKKFRYRRPALRSHIAIELAGAALKGLLSPALSSKGGEGGETVGSFGKCDPHDQLKQGVNALTESNKGNEEKRG